MPKKENKVLVVLAIIIYGFLPRINYATGSWSWDFALNFFTNSVGTISLLALFITIFKDKIKIFKSINLNTMIILMYAGYVLNLLLQLLIIAFKTGF